jgi:hypothetical protein
MPAFVQVAMQNSSRNGGVSRGKCAARIPLTVVVTCSFVYIHGFRHVKLLFMNLSDTLWDIVVTKTWRKGAHTRHRTQYAAQ